MQNTNKGLVCCAIDGDPDGVELVTLDQPGHNVANQFFERTDQGATEERKLLGQDILGNRLGIKGIEYLRNRLCTHRVDNYLILAQGAHSGHPRVGVQYHGPDPESHIGDGAYQTSQHDQEYDRSLAPAVPLGFSGGLDLGRLLPKHGHLGL
jgi:hypothetical protein